MRTPRFTHGMIIASALALTAFLAAPSQAYYHYVHFLNGVAAYEKFDLRALPNQTVSVYVNDSGPQSAAAFPAVLGQVKQAAAAWNSVSASNLRVVFAGLKASNQVSNTPGIDVVFTDDLPPGVLAQAAPTVANQPASGPDGAFFPIVRSVLMLNVNTNVRPGPAYAETYFATTLHEMGHTLGLQHTFTSSAMSQGVVRNTTRTRPLDADDIAAISLLYGKTGWSKSLASVSGRITSNGQGVALASVVALPGVGSPISALTNPDGTYQIKGIPPGQYLLYVHPLPPDADVTRPVNENGVALPSSGPFETVFFPAGGALNTGTREMAQVIPLNLEAGADLPGQNVDVQPRASAPVYDLVTFSYYSSEKQGYHFEGLPVTPAFLSLHERLATITFRSETGVTPMPQSATVLGGFTIPTVVSCCDSKAVAAYFYLPIFPVEGVRHLILHFENDMYVLPYAMSVVRRGPPFIDSVAPNADGSVTITGRNFGPDTRAFFDGLEAAPLKAFSGDVAGGSITVIPPPGYSGQQAPVVVYNTDGQSSMTLDSAALAYGTPLQYPAPVHGYPAAAQPELSISPAALPAGAFAKVEVTAPNMGLADLHTTLGFGTEDVTVERTWVVGPNRLLANVRVAPGAVLGTSGVSLISGFRMASVKAGFQTQPAAAERPSITALTNTVPTQATVYPGGSAKISGSNLAAGNPVRVTLNDVPLTVTAAGQSEITVLVPAGFPIGPATLTLNNGSMDALPVVAQISKAPPVVTAVTLFSGQPVDSTRPATMGDAIWVQLSGFDAGAATDPGRIRVTLGDITLKTVDLVVGENGSARLTVIVSNIPVGSQAPLAVWVDGSSSEPYYVRIL